MSNIVEYKGYCAQVEFSMEDHVLYGKIEGIADLVNFECSDMGKVQEAFQEAVDDYLAFCEDIGQEPNKAYKGSFNVRVSPELHRKADMERIKKGISLNQLVSRALELYLHPSANGISTTFVIPESVYLKSKSFQKYGPSHSILMRHGAEVPYVRD